MRDYFQVELERKLITKFGYGKYDELITQLVDWGYINDDRATKQFIISKLNSSYGEYYIKQKLHDRGVNVDASDILQIAEAENIDFEKHIKKLSEKYIDDDYDDAFKQYAKCISYLQKRGYALSTSMNIIKKGDFEK